MPVRAAVAARTEQHRLVHRIPIFGRDVPAAQMMDLTPGWVERQHVPHDPPTMHTQAVVAHPHRFFKGAHPGFRGALVGDPIVELGAGLGEARHAGTASAAFVAA